MKPKCLPWKELNLNNVNLPSENHEAIWFLYDMTFSHVCVCTYTLLYAHTNMHLYV